MTNTYAFGIHEANADNTIWVKVDADSNKAFFTEAARILDLNDGDASVADILSHLKDEFGILGIYLQDDAPVVDHAPHLYEIAINSVAILNEFGDVNVTFPLDSWVRRYGFRKDVNQGVRVY